MGYIYCITNKINGKQYISLRRFGDVLNNKMTAEEVTDLVDEHLTNKNTCIRCLRQGCQYKNGTVRIHCPLYKSSAV